MPSRQRTTLLELMATRCYALAARVAFCLPGMTINLIHILVRVVERLRLHEHNQSYRRPDARHASMLMLSARALLLLLASRFLCAVTRWQVSSAPLT